MPTDRRTPFLNCQSEVNGAGVWSVSSDYWSVRVGAKADADSLCGIIHGAYRAGWADKAAELRAIIMEGADAD